MIWALRKPKPKPLAQCWECPECGKLLATANPVLIPPPECGFFHPPVKMERRPVEAYETR